MDYTSRLRGDDVFPLVQDGENKVISADDLMKNIDNAIENQHHKHHCCHENPEIELDEIKCQAAKASLDSKEAKALAQDALSIGKEALEQSDQALDLATRANDKANAALKETDKISTIEDNITILTSQTNLNTKYLQQEISDRKDGDTNLQKQLTDSVNAINTNVVNGFTAINATTTKLQSDVDKVTLDLNTFISSTDADGIINKWTEVEKFLDSIDQNETLAGLLKKEEEKVDNLTYAASYKGYESPITINNIEHNLGLYVSIQVYVNGEEAVVVTTRDSEGNITVKGNWETTDTIIVQLHKVTKINKEKL